VAVAAEEDMVVAAEEEKKEDLNDDSSSSGASKDSEIQKKRAGDRNGASVSGSALFLRAPAERVAVSGRVLFRPAGQHQHRADCHRPIPSALTPC